MRPREGSFGRIRTPAIIGAEPWPRLFPVVMVRFPGAGRRGARGWGGPQYPNVLWTAQAVAAGLDGLTVHRAEQVERHVPTDGGERVAIDTLVRAERPA